jgi:hypothetical protein
MIKPIDLDCRDCSHFAETDRRSAEHCVVTAGAFSARRKSNNSAGPFLGFLKTSPGGISPDFMVEPEAQIDAGLARVNDRSRSREQVDGKRDEQKKK